MVKWSEKKGSDTDFTCPSLPPFLFFGGGGGGGGRVKKCEHVMISFWLTGCLECPKFKVANLLDTIIYVVSYFV